jgi:hypothetical protein
MEIVLSLDVALKRTVAPVMMATLRLFGGLMEPMLQVGWLG